HIEDKLRVVFTRDGNKIAESELGLFKHVEGPGGKRMVPLTTEEAEKLKELYQRKGFMMAKEHAGAQDLARKTYGVREESHAHGEHGHAEGAPAHASAKEETYGMKAESPGHGEHGHAEGPPAHASAKEAPQADRQLTTFEAERFEHMEHEAAAQGAELARA